MCKFCLFVITLLFFTSCLEWNNRSYLSELEKLSSITDSLSEQSSNISISSVDSLFDIRCGLLRNYKNQKQADTITLETAQHLENLKFSCENLKLFKENEDIFENIHTKQSELRKLKKFILKGNGNRSDYEKMVKKEAEYIHTLLVNFSELKLCYSNGMSNFEDSELYVKELINP
jgi:hypothetical protein